MGLPFFQGKAEFTELHPIAEKWCIEPQRIAERDDILISVRAPVGATNIADQRCCIGRGLAAIRYTPNPKLVFYYLRLIAKQLDEKGTGTTFKAISGDVLRDQPLPLPPLPEQRAIVAKIEQLFSELDNGVANLKKAQVQLKTYRQAVLKWAFEGKLTEEWRKGRAQVTPNPELRKVAEPTVGTYNRTSPQQHFAPQLRKVAEPMVGTYNRTSLQQHFPPQNAHELLSRIRREREEHAKKTGKKLKPVKPLTDKELAELPPLPDGWAWVKVEAVIDNDMHALRAGPFGSSIKKESYVSQGYKVYGQEQVIAGDETIGEYFINEEKYTELAGCRIQPFDILISLVGTIGKVLILSDSCLPGVINPRLIKLTLNRSYYLPDFFKYYFESEFVRSLYKVSAHGATMDVLNLGIIRTLPFPFCSLNEQHQIVQEIEKRLSVCDNIEANIEEALRKSEALRQSILKKAFEGKLLSPQELEETRRSPDWEPAEKLLERIKTERERKENGRVKKKSKANRRDV